MRHNCINLIQVTDESVEQDCTTCGAKETSVWECEKFGLCAPFVKGQLKNPGTVVDCNQCDEYKGDDMFCQFEKEHRLTYKCKVCGVTVSASDIKRVKRPCKGTVQPENVQEDKKPEDDTPPLLGSVFRGFGR